MSQNHQEHARLRQRIDGHDSQRMNAATEMTRHGGFALAQWVLSRLPRNPATMSDEDECLHVGALQAFADGPTNDLRSTVTAPSKSTRSFCTWDSGERVRRAALRKASPVVGSYQVGVIGSYCREARAGENGLQWSVGTRLIGFEKDRNSLGETQPRTCWIIFDSVPVCVAVDRLRPCTSAELLACQKLYTSRSRGSDTTRFHR